MGKNFRQTQNSELQLNLAVVAGCSLLLFNQHRLREPRISTALADPLAVIFLHYQR
jgi:hypothetical protein